jgi:hypothetical protein
MITRTFKWRPRRLALAVTAGLAAIGLVATGVALALVSDTGTYDVTSPTRKPRSGR